MLTPPSIFFDADFNTVPYDGSPIGWRVAIYGIWIKNSQILLVRHKDEQRWDLPGGGVEMGEELPQALARESREEAGCELQFDHIISAYQDWFYHRVEKKFYRSLQLMAVATSTQEPGAPLDLDMVQPRWVKLSQLKQVPIFPNILTAVSSLKSSLKN